MLILTLGFSALTFRTRKHGFDRAFTDAFLLNSLISVGSAGMTLVWEDEAVKVMFVGTEVVMILIATAWGTVKITACYLEGKGGKGD